jgi:hypothetical protein
MICTVMAVQSERLPRTGHIRRRVSKVRLHNRGGGGVVGKWQLRRPQWLKDNIQMDIQLIEYESRRRMELAQDRVMMVSNSFGLLYHILVIFVLNMQILRNTPYLNVESSYCSYMRDFVDSIKHSLFTLIKWKYLWYYTNHATQASSERDRRLKWLGVVEGNTWNCAWVCDAQWNMRDTLAQGLHIRRGTRIVVLLNGTCKYGCILFHCQRHTCLTWRQGAL